MALDEFRLRQRSDIFYGCASRIRNLCQGWVRSLRTVAARQVPQRLQKRRKYLHVGSGFGILPHTVLGNMTRSVALGE